MVLIATIVGCIAVITTVFALFGLETRFSTNTVVEVSSDNEGSKFREALRDVLSEHHTRRFALFVFIPMLAYSAQDLVLEPYAGAVFGLTPGESTKLGGVQHGGVLLGMLLVAFIGYRFSTYRNGVMRLCMMTGCLASGLLLALLALAGFMHQGWPLHANVLALGLANGAFAVAAIGAMMGLVSKGHRQRDGVRMGVWGAAQAIAFGAGGIAGTLAVDIVRYLSGSAQYAYSLVFFLQALLFVTAAFLAAEITRRSDRTSQADSRGDLEHVF